MQNVRFKHDSSSFVQTLWGFGLVVFVVLGIGGTIYKLISPNGWIAALMGSSFSGAVVALGLLIVFSALGWLVRASTSTRQQAGVASQTMRQSHRCGLQLPATSASRWGPSRLNPSQRLPPP